MIQSRIIAPNNEEDKTDPTFDSALKDFKDNPCCDKMREEYVGAEINITLDWISYWIEMWFRTSHIDNIRYCPWCGTEIVITAQQRW